MAQPIPIFEGFINRGKLKILDHQKKAIARWCSTFKNGTNLDITVRKHSSKRSNQQNKYYWGVVVNILGNHFGYDPEEMHEELKYLFNSIHSRIDPKREIGSSTTKLSTEEFVDYTERICRWAAMECQVYVPPPEKAEGE